MYLTCFSPILTSFRNSREKMTCGDGMTELARAATAITSLLQAVNQLHRQSFNWLHRLAASLGCIAWLHRVLSMAAKVTCHASAKHYGVLHRASTCQLTVRVSAPHLAAKVVCRLFCLCQHLLILVLYAEEPQFARHYEPIEWRAASWARAAVQFMHALSIQLLALDPNCIGVHDFTGVPTLGVHLHPDSTGALCTGALLRQTHLEAGSSHDGSHPVIERRRHIC